MTQVIENPGSAQDRDRAVSSRFVPLNPNAGKGTNADGDGYDGKRIELVRGGGGWGGFDDLVRQQNRQIEENVRMLSGQQHSVFHPIFNRWLDVTEWMPQDEQRWRARVVINRLLPWFMVTHARATENTPIVTYVPGPDLADADLAEMLDILGKTTWWEAGMEDVHDQLMGWVVAAGRGHTISRINPHKGQMRPWIGDDLVPMVDENEQAIGDDDGGQAHMPAQGVPFGPDGKPRAVVIRRSDGSHEVRQTGEPHMTPIGQIEVAVLSPIQVRGSWGPEPWHRKRKHWIRSYHTPEEAYDMFGVELTPTIRSGQVSDIGELERLLYGTGFYNAVAGEWPGQTAKTNTDGFVEVTQLWEAPCNYPGMERTEESPGGRWLVVTPNKVIRDGVRPAAFPHTSPLNTFEFVRIPGRPGGTTPQEMLNPAQRLYNDGYGRIRDHVALSTNPKGVIDQSFGIKTGQFDNRPGVNYIGTRRPGVPAIEYVAPPRLGEDVYKFQEMLRGELDDLGFMIGASDPGAPGESGEKLKEARFNTDRYMGPTMRRAASEYGRMFETWMAFYPTIMDMQTVIAYTGDDNIARSITVFPEMFKEGKVNVRADVESMLPEGRGEKQDKVMMLYDKGMFGLPGSPEALKKFWEAIQMPHLGRVGKPGGVDRVTAEHENGELLLGGDPTHIPVYEWYDDLVHLMVHENYMKSPEFRDLPKKRGQEGQMIQDAFTLHRQAHMLNMQKKMATQVAQQAATQAALTPPGKGGAPGGGKPGAGPSEPAQPKPANDRSPSNLRPPLPAPPTAPIPGGRMPTAAT